MFTLLVLAACDTPVVNNYNTTNEYTNIYQVGGDTGGMEEVPAAVEDTGWQQIDPPAELEPTTTPDLLGLDPFAMNGVVYWYDMTEQEELDINTAWETSIWGNYGPLYTVTDGGGGTFVDHLYVMTVDGAVADFGQVAVSNVGQSSGAYVSATTIPNFSNDANEYVEGQYFDYATNMDHLRLNNAAVGSMFGERMAYALWEAVGYPVPKSAYAFMGGTPWQDSETLIPMVAVQQYKTTYCDEQTDYFGADGCKNIWEWYGADLTSGNIGTINGGCEVHGGCDITDLTAFAKAVDDNIYYPGFEAATAPYLDWPMYQLNMCLSYYTQTGDDWIHNLNNQVLIQGQLFIPEPYSVDINGGFAWNGAWTGMDLWGMSNLSVGCEYDPECYAETMDVCNALFDFMDTLDPANTILPELYDELKNTPAPWGEDGGDGMLRPPDDDEYVAGFDFYDTRAEDAREELAAYVQPTTCGPWSWWDTGVSQDPRCAGFYDDTSDTSDTAHADTSDTSVDTAASPDTAVAPDTASPDTAL